MQVYFLNTLVSQYAAVELLDGYFYNSLLKPLYDNVLRVAYFDVGNHARYGETWVRLGDT